MGLNRKDTKDLTLDEKVTLAINYLASEETQLKRFGNFVYDHTDDKCFFGNRSAEKSIVHIMRTYGFDPIEGGYYNIFDEVLYLIQENKRLKAELEKLTV